MEIWELLIVISVSVERSSKLVWTTCLYGNGIYHDPPPPPLPSFLPRVLLSLYS